MISDLDVVALTRDIPDSGLIAGDVGAVVHVHGSAGYEVEFVTGGGKTVAVLTLDGSAIRPLRPGDMLHTRSLGPDGG